MTAAAELLDRLRAELALDVLSALGRGLSLADPPQGLLGQALEYEARGSRRLAELQLRVFFKSARFNPAFCERLAEADELPWPYVYEAVLGFEANEPLVTP
jgi:hypothetical protein